MKKGTVRWYDEKRGYGVIAPDGEGPDLFVDNASVTSPDFKSLRDNDLVEYDLGDGPRGACAINVRVLPPDSIPERTEHLLFTRG